MKTGRIEVDGKALDVGVDENGNFHAAEGRRIEPDEWRWLAPPHRVIYGLALNFADHARELNFAELPEEPIPFIKNPSFGSRPSGPRGASLRRQVHALRG